MTNEATFPSRISFPSWQSQVQAATDETDTAKLLSRVHAAESAIFNRLQELAKLPQSGRVHIAEREFLAEALETLRRLKRDRLGFPDWVEKKSNS
jgi:hypothetical protein